MVIKIEMNKTEKKEAFNHLVEDFSDIIAIAVNEKELKYDELKVLLEDASILLNFSIN